MTVVYSTFLSTCPNFSCDFECYYWDSCIYWYLWNYT